MNRRGPPDRLVALAFDHVAQVGRQERDGVGLLSAGALVSNRLDLPGLSRRDALGSGLAEVHAGGFNGGAFSQPSAHGEDARYIRHLAERDAVEEILAATIDRVGDP